VTRETAAILHLSRLGRGILTPPRRRAFWPGRPPRGGGLPAALPALLHASFGRITNPSPFTGLGESNRAARFADLPGRVFPGGVGVLVLIVAD